MEFDWSPIDNDEWRRLLAETPRANLLQSWPHALGARLHDQMTSRRARILASGRTLGIMQIQEIRVGPIHVLRLHRGPLWFAGEESPERWGAFFAAFNRTFPRRIGRWRQLLPELEDGDEMRDMLSAAGLRPRNPEPYQTVLINLHTKPQDIRRSFKGKWRNALGQAERSGIEIVCDAKALSAQAFLDRYGADIGARGYRGAKPARLETMIAAARPTDDALIVNAEQDGQTIAAMLFFRHGVSATYQAGWTSDAGRRTRAHHLTLWNAIQRLRKDGVETLDLGGIHPRMAEGVTRFKQGLGGRPLTLPGLYG